MEEDELYDDRILHTNTTPRYSALNVSAMSCSSKQSGRLSLGFRRPCTQTLALVSTDSAKMPCPTVLPVATTHRNRFCRTCGLPEKMVLGNMESHRKNCAGDGFPTRSLECPSGINCSSTNPNHFKELSHQITSPLKAGSTTTTTMSSQKRYPEKQKKPITNPNSSVFQFKDCNQNRICPKLGTSTTQVLDAQENMDAVKKIRSTNRVQLSDQSNIWPSQSTTLTLLGITDSQQTSQLGKPSDIVRQLKRNYNVPRNLKTRQKTDNLEQSRRAVGLGSLPAAGGAAWVMDRMMKNAGNDVSLAEIVVDKLVKKEKCKPHRKARKVERELTYVEGATSSEEESDSRRLACPVYKMIPGTKFAVDALFHGEDSRVEAHFLTRFRKELSPSGSVPIYCTPITARLLSCRPGAETIVIRELQPGTPRIINGVKVTAIDALSEPGSAALLFELPGNVTVFYVGDVRCSFTVESFPAFWLPTFALDYLMVDTARCCLDAARPQKEEIETFVLQLVEDHMDRHTKSIVVLLSDGLLENRLSTLLALTFKLKIFAHGEALKTMQQINAEFLTDDPEKAGLHIIEQASHLQDNLAAQLKRSFYHALILNPADLVEFEKPNTNWNVTVLDFPASSAASLADLERLVKFLRPKALISSLRPRHDRIQTRLFASWLGEPLKPGSVEKNT